MSKQRLSRKNFLAVCSFDGLVSIVQSGPRHGAFGFEVSLSERQGMKLTSESKESDFLNRFIRKKHCLEAWSRQNVANQSGRHSAPIQVLAALLAMAKKTFYPGRRIPVSGSILSGSLRARRPESVPGQAVPWRQSGVDIRLGRRHPVQAVELRATARRLSYLRFPTEGLTGPVDSRTTSSGSTMITSRGSTLSWIRSSRYRVAILPISSKGWLIVVSRGKV